jgi:hypothetical protein
MCTGENRDRAGQLGVVGKRPVNGGVGAQDIRQNHGIGMVGLLTGHGVSLPVAGHRQRIDRIHRPSARPECRNQQPTRGLDRDRDPGVAAVAGGGQHFDQFREPVDGLRDAFLGHQSAFVVN